jgi:CBS domain-containing protein
MQIGDVLRGKGDKVVTVTPDTDVRRLVATLGEHGIGAVVVSTDGRSVDGIVSERDVVRALSERGEAVLAEPVTAIYTAEVHSVGTDARIEELMRLMTDRRIRHVPVVKDDALCGIVSIGDVVKNRIEELESESAALSSYISTAR